MSRSGRAKVILPNIPGHMYTFGPKYPGERAGEVFISCKQGLFVNPTHFTISVDEEGEYWIQNATSTFLNSEKVESLESRLLRNGDVISERNSGTETEGTRPGLQLQLRPIYHVNERIIPIQGSDLKIEEVEAEDCTDTEMEPDDEEFSLINNLLLPEILRDIMTRLSLPDLKNARLVCKKWKTEASAILEKKGQVSFSFDCYRSSTTSTKVFSYLHQMEALKLNLNLHIDLRSLLVSPGESGNKVLDDLQKLLNSSQNISSLSLDYNIEEESDFLRFHLIFEELGLGNFKLHELTLEGSLEFFPEVMPPLPSMPNLKKFTHEGTFGADLTQKWVTHLVPLFKSSLEFFECEDFGDGDDMKATYLQEFLKHGMPNLKGITIGASSSELSLLLQLRNPLTVLNLTIYKTDCSLLETLVMKNAKSLKQLLIEIYPSDEEDDEIVVIKFPPFPNLEEFELKYDLKTRVNFGTGLLDYNVQFPSLKKLTVWPPLWARYREGQDVAEDYVFNTFFPKVREMGCETVNDMFVSVILDVNVVRGMVMEGYTPVQLNFSQARMDKIMKMFPNPVNMNFFKKNFEPW